jgi:hypothetical protein
LNNAANKTTANFEMDLFAGIFILIFRRDHTRTHIAVQVAVAGSWEAVSDWGLARKKQCSPASARRECTSEYNCWPVSGLAKGE